MLFQTWKYHIMVMILISSRLTNSLNKFRNHPSIIMIRTRKKWSKFFCWSSNLWCIEKVPDTAKEHQQSDIATKILKQNSNYFVEYFYQNMNQSISKSIFPSDLKLADVTPVYKKNSKNPKNNYRLVSILSNISKIYERCIYDEM